MSPDMMTPEQAADYLQVSRSTVYNMLKDGRLKAVKIGRQWRIRKEELGRLSMPDDDINPEATEDQTE